MFRSAIPIPNPISVTLALAMAAPSYGEPSPMQETVCNRHSRCWRVARAHCWILESPPPVCHWFCNQTVAHATLVFEKRRTLRANLQSVMI